MGHDAYIQELTKRKAPCAKCSPAIGIEREAGTILVICALAPKFEWEKVGRVAIARALQCPGPQKSPEDRIAFLQKPPDS